MRRYYRGRCASAGCCVISLLFMTFFCAPRMGLAVRVLGTLVLAGCRHQHLEDGSISVTGQVRRRSYGGGFTAVAKCCRV